MRAVWLRQVAAARLDDASSILLRRALLARGRPEASCTTRREHARPVHRSYLPGRRTRVRRRDVREAQGQAAQVRLRILPRDREADALGRGWCLVLRRVGDAAYSAVNIAQSRPSIVMR